MEQLQTNRQIEDAAIAQVLHLEAAAGRAAVDTRGRGALVIVENVRQGEPGAFRVLDLSGERLAALLTRKREKHYVEVPFPVAAYDAAVSETS